LVAPAFQPVREWAKGHEPMAAHPGSKKSPLPPFSKGGF
jgi:hypothetical protein